MKTDRELLELAAKAAGVDVKPVEIKNVEFIGDDRFIGYSTDPRQWQRGWFDPLTDDGDALRLAVKLKLRIEADVMLCGTNGLHPSGTALVDYGDGDEVEEPHNGNDFAATRRAIVRAAAAIGEAMP